MSRRPVVPENARMRAPISCIFDRLQKIDDNSARVQLLYEELEKCHGFPEIPKIEKSVSISREFRKKGNTFFVQQRNAEALDSYQSAIATAPKDSSELALGFGNRSAVFFALGLHEHTLLDISRALEAGCDELLKPKLLRRRAACENARDHGPHNIENGRKILLEKLTNRNPNIPCASADVNISYDSRFGRCVIATRDIPVGSVLAIEEPYSAILSEFKSVLGCYGCCQPTSSLIPCETCSIAMFCSKECRSRTWDQYHKYECPLMDFCCCWELDNEIWLALRTVLKARHDHESWNDLIKTIEEAETQIHPVFKCFIPDDLPESSMQIFDSTRYMFVHRMESNVARFNDVEFGKKGTAVATLLKQLKTSTTFFSDNFELNEENNDSIVYSVGGLILHLSMISSTNAQDMEINFWNNNLSANPAKFLSNNYALGLYPFLSLINHSCNPNVEILSVITSNLALTVSPIKKGQQIFKSYRNVYWLNEHDKRQQEMRIRYRFRCKCEACRNQWPLFFMLPCGVFPSTDRFNEYRNVFIRMIKEPNKETSIEMLNQLCNDIELSDHSIPTKMILNLKALLVASWSMFGNNAFRI